MLSQPVKYVLSLYLSLLYLIVVDISLALILQDGLLSVVLLINRSFRCLQMNISPLSEATRLFMMF